MLYNLPEDDILLTLGITDEDEDYPASNGLLNDPSVPMHSLGTTSATVTLTSASAVAAGLYLINIGNLAGATVLFNGGGAVNEPITIPARTADGHGRNVFVDLRAFTTPTTTRTITITGAAISNQIGFGRIFLVSEIRTLDVIIGPKFRTTQLDVPLLTVAGYRFVTPKLVKNRATEIKVLRFDEKDKLEVLQEATFGRVIPFPLVPWHDRTDVWWVKFADEHLPWEETEGLDIADATVVFEHWMGLPLDFVVI